MKRVALDFLDSWYKKNNSKPLILRGARQVGKSTLVRLFYRQYQINLIELDFETVKLRQIENETSFSIGNFTGGMHEAVQCKVDGGDHEEIRDIQNAIIQTYQDDIPKYTSNKEYSRVMDVFEYTAANLGNKVVFSDVAAVHSKSIQSAPAGEKYFLLR